MRYVIIILILSSCGFTPLHSNKSQDKLDLLHKQIKLINKVNLRDLSLGKKIIYKSFSQKFNSSYQNIVQKYQLSVDNIRESEYPIDLDLDGNSSGYSYNITIDISLKDITQNNKIIFSKSYNAQINLNIGSSHYSSIISKRSYQKTLAKNIADQCYQEILLLLYQ
jgi:hypothetical protein